jgi:hypothetical protein
MMNRPLCAAKHLATLRDKKFAENFGAKILARF